MPEKIHPSLQGETFSNEASLPTLSVPSLHCSLDQLKKSLAPMLNEGDFHYLQEKIDEFLADPISSKLQNHLHKFQQNEACYLDHLNLDHTLVDHHSLPRNPFLVLENDPLKDYILPQGQASRAAVLATSSLKFIASLRLGVLKPDKSRSGRPLTMKPYLNLFATTRYPESNSVRMKSFENSKHLIILSNSLFFRLEVLNDNHELLLSSDELNSVLDDVIQVSNNTDRLKNIGSITSDIHKYWKHGKALLTQEYKENMASIDSALFVLVLDHSSPNDKDDEEIAKTISVGTLDVNEAGIQVGSCNSRWYDKLQLIVTKNAIAGVCWDSYGQDGTTMLRFTSDIYADSVLRLAEGESYTLFPQAKFAKLDPDDKPALERLQWNFGSEIATFLHLSETRLSDLICSHSTNTTTIKFGETFAKKIGIKADSLIQVSLQIAHYALYGKPLATVEPVTTRFFRNARSEFVPIQDDFLLKTCQIFVSDSSKEDRWEAFMASCQHHADSLLAASKGLGFETHIKALQNVFIEREVFSNLSPEFSIDTDTPPPLLFDNVLRSLFIPDLIASNCGNPAMRLFGITPANHNGFGIGYIVKHDETKISIISEYRQGERLLNTLEWVIYQIRQIWKSDLHRSSIIPHAHILDNQKKESASVAPQDSNTNVLSRPMTRESRSYSIQSDEKDVDLALGGYGYFDIEELTVRSAHQSRSSTPLHSNVNSTTNLDKYQHSQKNLLKEAGKKLKFEYIKDNFEIKKNDNGSATSLVKNAGSENSDHDNANKHNYNLKFDRAAVGKKVEIDDL